MVSTTVWEGSYELSPHKKQCGWVGPLPEFSAKSPCESCRKLRSAGDVIRCQMRGGPRIEGLGDLISTVTHATGVAQTVEKVANFFNTDCGCLQRQYGLNQAFPIGTDETPADEQ